MKINKKNFVFIVGLLKIIVPLGMRKANDIKTKIILKVTPIVKNQIFASFGSAPILELIKFILF